MGRFISKNKTDRTICWSFNNQYIKKHQYTFLKASQLCYYAIKYSIYTKWESLLQIQN